MKKLLLIGAPLLVAAVGAGSVLSVDQYRAVKANQAEAARVAQVEDAKRVEAAAKVRADQAMARRNAYLAVKAECSKGVVAYDLLAPAVKAKVAKPVCEQPGALEVIAAQ